ncbi:ATP-dependent sacrificial sulfur transferase LarE [Anatilimnocola sp. NA78]|uniref:ATP-dependent sacrificial sulfur transferase LarE n=1 Tax=Anatilimnocola sp. NA78 TaxID=3415683 RepID=UPI003CE586AF
MIVPTSVILDDRLTSLRDALLAYLQPLPSAAVAFSGGVDSAVVAQAAYLALGDKAVAVTGVSASLASGELELAREIAQQIGIRHEIVSTEELARTGYVANAPDRCYHCKTELYTKLTELAPAWGVSALLNGANLDDLGDYRPGMKAASEFRVLSPLAECGLNKADVRELARFWQLPCSDKPATPCLSSRIAYGEQVTPERLARIDQAEVFLRELGLGEIRVRLHAGELARIEVPLDVLPQLAQPEVREKITQRFKSLGFRFVTLDLQGFRSGSMNTLLSLSKK